MKKSMVISILLFFLFYSCQKETDDQLTFPLKAKVIGSNPDCGVFSIKFTSGLDSVELITGQPTWEGTYIAKNLPVELQQPGLNILLDIRKIKDSELGVCTAMGPSYPWLYVIKAIKE